MATWMHVTVWFTDIDATAARLIEDAAQKHPNGAYKELIVYLKALVDACGGAINRYFYFFEPDPPLFMALELNTRDDFDSVSTKLQQIEKPDFVERIATDIDTGDENNGEAVIDFYHAGTKFAFFRVGEGYKPGYENRDESQLVHCFCNQLFVNPKNEADFHLACLRLWGFSPGKEGALDLFWKQHKKFIKRIAVIVFIFCIALAILEVWRTYKLWDSMLFSEWDFSQFFNVYRPR